MKVVITEKFNQGEVVASAILDSPSQEKMNGEPYWEDDEIVIIPLQGQIFELDNLEGRDGYPDFPELEWTTKNEHQTKEKLLTHFLSQDLDECIIGSDFDREGELIGTLGILIPKWGEADYSYLDQWDVTVSRMKYSALVEHEVADAWDNRGEPDKGLFHMGMARAEIDYRVGINLSRALTKCLLRGMGEWNTMSVGRVQTPLLKIITERTQQHEDHDAEMYWVPRIEVKPT